MTSSASLHVRRATPSDASVLEQLARKTFADTFRDTCTAADLASFLDASYAEALFRKDLNDASVELWLAEVQGVPVGYLQAADTPVPFPHPEGPSLELQRLYVHQDWQGAGVAKALMEQYLQLAAQRNADFLWLGVWEHNLRAQAFYRKWGFAPTGYTHPFPIGGTPQTDEWWSRERQPPLAP